MSKRLITAPATEPISLAEAKSHCRVDGADDDTWFSAIAIPAARVAAEHELGRRLISQTWEQVLDAFPTAEIELPDADVSAITSVRYTATNTTDTLLASDQYVLDSYSTPCWLLPATNVSWPATADTTNALRIQYVVGMAANAAAVPATIKAWMLLHIGTAYKFKESVAQGGTVAELPGRYTDALLDAYRIWTM